MYTKQLLKCSFFLLLGVFVLSSCQILHRKKSKKSVVDSVSAALTPSSIKPYKEIITDKSVSSKGLFKIHQVDEQYFFEIPDSLLGREILVVTRTSRTAPGLGYGGEALHRQVIRFEKFQNKRLNMRSVSYAVIADSTASMYQSVRNSNMAPIAYAFEIKALSPDSTATVINVTDLFGKDNPLFTISDQKRKDYKISGADDSKSAIISIHSYERNIEIRNTFTYYLQPDAALSNPSGLATVEINNSLLLLPKKPMIPRLFDKRVGYFAQKQIDYSRDDLQKALRTTYIRRWKLIPKDTTAYFRGELVEPIKPIVFYMDPATPAKWIPYLIAGVNDWNKAFEKAGFKNAISAKVAPTKAQDSTFSTEDARYSAIRYFASEIGNAYGPHIADPRSGEIIESHVGWYHNVMHLLHNWFFIQTAAVNPAARKNTFNDEVMGKLIRFVSSHEIGHTLGLRHNFAASFAYPVDSLRSKTFTEKMGTAPSIMDYARFNYVAQPGDNAALFPSIGPYDMHAIEWGYRYYPNIQKPTDETLILNKLITARRDPIYFFGTERNAADPRSQSEDLGNDAIKASSYGIANLKRIVPHLQDWTYAEAKNYDDLKELYLEIQKQWMRYMKHVVKNIGGVYETPKTYDEYGVVYQAVDKETQKRAMIFLHEQAFSAPKWMTHPTLLRLFDQAGVVAEISRMQTKVLKSVLDQDRLMRLIENETFNPQSAYTLSAFFADLQKGIFASSQPDTYLRNLQRAYLDQLDELLNMPDLSNFLRLFDGSSEGKSLQHITIRSDIGPLVRKQLKILLGRLKGRGSNEINKAHFEDLTHHIQLILNPK